MESSKANIKIRIAVPEDAPAIASVLYESFVEYKSRYTPEGFAATTPTSDEIQKRIEEGPIWIVECDYAVVGTVSVVPKGEGLYVRGMAILPAARGKTIGNLLLRQVEDFASDQGFKRLFLSTTPFLDRAIRLYEHYGFRRSSEGPDNLFGTPLFTMEKIHNSSREEV